MGMSKVRARERAKANALKKAKRRAANKDKSKKPILEERITPGNSFVKGPGASADIKSFGTE